VNFICSTKQSTGGSCGERTTASADGSIPQEVMNITELKSKFIRRADLRIALSSFNDGPSLAARGSPGDCAEITKKAKKMGRDSAPKLKPHFNNVDSLARVSRQRVDDCITFWAGRRNLSAD
jgi:hypothetical protein